MRTIHPSVSGLSIDQRFPISAAVENTLDHDLIGFYNERDRRAAPEADNAQAGPDIMRA